MSDHGPLFDSFRDNATDPHGPHHDEFGHPSAGADGHGALFDEFDRRVTAGAGKHGALWDEFGWVTMPAMHGQNMDTDFNQPAALDGGEHGTWFDVFRGGTNVRAIIDGKDVEAVVLNANADHLVVQTRNHYGQNNGGDRHEIGLGQIRELRHATQQGQAKETRKPTAQPGKTQERVGASSADAPSAHDATARGGGRTPVSMPSDAKAMTVKTELSDDDVAKTLDELRALADDLEQDDVAKAVGLNGPTFHPVHNPHYGVDHPSQLGAGAKPHPLAHPAVHQAYGHLVGSLHAYGHAAAAHTAAVRSPGMMDAGHNKATSDHLSAMHQAKNKAIRGYASAAAKHGLGSAA